MSYETELELYLSHIISRIGEEWKNYIHEAITKDEFLYYLRGILDTTSFGKADLEFLFDFIEMAGYDIMQYDDDVAYLTDDDVAYLTDDDNDGEAVEIPTIDPAHAYFGRIPTPADNPPDVVRADTITEEAIITLRNAMAREDLRREGVARPTPTIQVIPGRRLRD